MTSLNKEQLKNEIYKLNRYRVTNDNPISKLLYPAVEAVRLDSVISILDNVESLVIPQEVAALIEYQKEIIRKEGQIKQRISIQEADELDFDIKKAMDWVNRNYDEYCEAYTNGYIVPEPKTYRFTQNAFMEQDFTADSFEEAKKQAQAEWKRMFEKEGLFGEPEFEKELEE